jgi:hypothetical protein
MRSILLVFAMAVLAGCGSGERTNEARPEPTANQAGAQTQPEAKADTGVTQAWLAGRWKAGDGACGAGEAFFTLEADGRYALAEEQGRWTLNGDRLTIEVTRASSDSGTEAGQRNTTTVRRIGPDEAEFIPQGQTPIRVVRCP